MIPFVLRGATVLDGSGGAPAHDTDVWVADGRIAGLGADLVVPEGTREIDASERWVIPGLVDAHVHLMTTPGEGWLDLDEPGREALIREHLRAYLACGVTTVVDAGAIPARRQAIQGWIDGGAPAPRVWWLGQALGPAGGYPSNLEPGFDGLSDRASIAAAFDVAAGNAGVKVTFERGFSRHDDWPLFDEAQRAALREESRARGIPLFVHAMTPSEFLPAAELGPRAFVHGPERPDDDVTRAIARSGAFVVTTLSIYDAPIESGLDDPLGALVVPARERAAALDHATTVAARRAIGALVLPGMPAWATGMGASVGAVARARLKSALRAVRDLHGAGVPLVLGTDSGTWPVFHTHFHGWSALHELELLARAGLDPMEVLLAGTATPARMLDLSDEIGAIAVGRPADLVVLGRDPLADPTAYRAVVWTARAGELHTPEEWMAR